MPSSRRQAKPPDEAIACANEITAGGFSPSLCVVLGSGLASAADVFHELARIDYGDLPGFPPVSVDGHPGRLLLADIEGLQAAVLIGRPHFYENNDIQQAAFPGWLAAALGCRWFFVTNAAGALDSNLGTGDFVVISSHINFLGATPIRWQGAFLDTRDLYNSALRHQVLEAAASLTIPASEGIYAAYPGPSYETPAEARMLAVCGASCVGMSTVPEALAAHAGGVDVVALSVITNTPQSSNAYTGEVSHEDVLSSARRSADGLGRIVARVSSKLVRQID